MGHFGEVGVKTHPVAVAADVDDVTVVQKVVAERGSHDLVAEDLALLLEALVGREHRGRTRVASVHELEQEHGTGWADRWVADLVNDQEGRVGQAFETVA